MSERELLIEEIIKISSLDIEYLRKMDLDVLRELLYELNKNIRI